MKGAVMTFPQIPAEPHAWPFDGDLRKENTALVVIDMQVDFCSPGGFGDQVGIDVSILRQPIEPLQRVLGAMRETGTHILHTREGHRTDLADLNETKRWRSRRSGAEIGTDGPLGRMLVRGEPGWDIVPELAPLPDEPVIDKPGKGAFYATELDQILRCRGIRNLIICGITTDCCVHTTMRDANDRGYECLLLEDCCAASEVKNHDTIVRITKVANGQMGAVTSSKTLLSVLAEDHLRPPEVA
jgi:nicotinamidase-related amidase